MLVPAKQSKGKIRKFEELWIKIIGLIRSITKNSDVYGEKYMKIKFNSDNELPLSKTIEIPQVFLDECLYELQSRKKQKYNLRKKKFLYFNCIIDSCQYLLLSDKI